MGDISRLIVNQICNVCFVHLFFDDTVPDLKEHFGNFKLF